MFQVFPSNIFLLMLSSEISHYNEQASFICGDPLWPTRLSGSLYKCAEL